MAKAYSKAAKIRAKKARSEFALAGIPQREADGRPKRSRDPDYERNPSTMVLKIRALHMGLGPEKARDMRNQMLGEDAGRALYLLSSPDNAARLWQHYVSITAAEARYHRSLGKSIHAKTAKIEMMVDATETRPDDVIDLRTPEEKDQDAVNRWMHWQGLLGHIAGHESAAIYAAYRYHRRLVDQGKVLAAGVRFVAAMRALDAVIERRG